GADGKIVATVSGRRAENVGRGATPAWDCMMTAPRPADGRMDDLDRRLIAVLQEDPRISYADLGKQLGVSGMTAATRLNRLRAADLLWCRALPNFQTLELATQVFGYVQVDLSALGQVVETLLRSPYVLRIDRVAGEF